MLKSMDELPSETAPVTVAVIKPPSTVQLTGAELASLARELVMDIYPLQVVLAHFKITETQYDDEVKTDANFRRFYDYWTQEWNSALSTPQRLKLQAAAYLEANLPKVAARMLSNTEDLGKINEVAKTLTKIAGIGEATLGGNPGEKFNIVINLGTDKEISIEKTLGLREAPDAAAESAGEILALAQGEAGADALRAQPGWPSEVPSVSPLGEGPGSGNSAPAPKSIFDPTNLEL